MRKRKREYGEKREERESVLVHAPFPFKFQVAVGVFLSSISCDLFLSSSHSQLLGSLSFTITLNFYSSLRKGVKCQFFCLAKSFKNEN